MDVYTKSSLDEVFDQKDFTVTVTDDHELILRVEDHSKSIERLRLEKLRPVLEIKLYEHEAEKLFNRLKSQLEK